MIAEIAIILGIFIMIYGAYICGKVFRLIKKGSHTHNRWWIIIFALIFLFLFGYIGYLLLLSMQFPLFDPNILVGIIFFFGAIYVVISMKLIFDIFSEILGFQEETKNYAENLERIVDEETKELREKSENLTQKVENLSRSRTAMINILEDVDEMAKKLAEEKNKDEAILESIGDAVLAVDLDRRIIVFNKAAQEITGFSERSVLGKVYSEVLKFTDTKREVVSCGKNCMVDQVYKTGKSFYFEEMIVKNKKGQQIPIADSVAPIKDNSGKIIGAIMTFRDIRKELEIEKLKAESQAMIEVEKTRREFVSVVSHELRTPMTGIKGWLGMLLDGEAGKINPKVKQYLEEAYKNNERLLTLIEDMLSVSRIEQGKTVIMPNKMDLKFVVSEMIEDFELQAENKGLELKYSPPKDLPAVYADVNKVKEVLSNLLGNAIKFTNKGGVTVENEILGKNIVTYIEDTGTGIPKRDLKHIFEKFYQVENPLSREQQGSGLGLYITKTLVENMGGEIWVRSRAGKGTTFAFGLPIYTGKESKKEEPSMSFIERVVKEAKEPRG